jgi:polyhydroxyalkanoate synthesis regulator phasin
MTAVRRVAANGMEPETALEELKKSAALADKRHYDTLSAALESLGKRVAKLENEIRANKKKGSGTKKR